MASSDIVIGKVVVLQGHAYIRTAGGAQIELKLGDPIHEGDVIVTGPGAVVQIGYGQGETYVVHQNETVTVDNSVFAVDGPDAHNAALTAKGAQLATITDAIASGNGSLDQLLEASAAGLGGGGGDTNDGHTFVQLVRIVEATTPAGLPTSTDDGSGQQTGQSSRTGISGPTAQDVAVSDTVSTAHEQPVHIRLTGTDASAPITSFTILDLPTNGTLYLADGKTPVHAGEVVSASGNGADLVFVAAAGTTAALASFHFSATDSQGAISNVATGTIDIIAAPAITINPIATIDSAEAGSAAPIAITGTVSSNVPVGDTVTLTVDGHSYTGTVQAGGTYSIGVPGNVLAGASVDSIHATVSVTNASGSVSTATADQGYNVELNAPAITISIDPIAPIDIAEAASSAPIAINGKVSSNVPVGDTVTLTVGGHSYTGTVQVGGTYSIGIPGNVLATAPVDSVHASVSATDAAGNTASASADQPYTLVTTPDSISISIDPIATINGAEAASGNPIAITGTVSSNVPVGDTVTLTVDGHSYTGTVQAGGTYSIGIPGNVLAAGPIDIVHATVSASDPAGNVLNASADQGYNVELVAPAISITIAPIAAITTAEAASSAPIAITGTVSSNVPIGDTVTLTIDGHTYTGTVHAGGTYSIGVPGNVLAAGPIDSVHASVSMTDAAGNSASASADQSYTVQGVSNPPTITIDPIATVNGAEGTSSVPVAITGTVSANVPVGDTVTLTVDGHSYTGFVLAGGVYSIGIPGNILAGAATDDVHASVSITDAGGHVLTGTADQAYFVELNAPAISISIDPIAAITVSEGGSSAPVAITGTVSANVPVGDTVTLTVDGHTYTGTVQAGGTYSIGVPGNILAGASIDDVHASVAATDAAGNVANASADQSYTVLSSAPVISISIDPIATINGAEAGSSNPVTITGTVSSNVPVGDTVTLTIDGNVYTGTVQAGGTYSIGVPGNVLGSSTSDDVHVSVSVGSGAGTSTATADQNYNVELTAPAISIAIDPIADVTGSAGSSSTPIAITGTVSSNVPVGDTVTLTVDGHNYSGTVQAGGTYSIGVPGNVLAAAPIDSVHASVSMTDAAGNVASAGADQTYHVALDPNAITIEIDPIATINGAEAASANPIAITGTVSANVPVGDTVTLTIDGHDYTGTVQAGGTYSIDIPGTVLGAAASDNVHASVSATDSGGNVVNATADQGYTVELVAPAINIAINAIPTITNAEAASANPVAINGTVSANVPVGDTVTLTVDGHDYTGTVQAGGTYSIGVPGNVLAGATTDSVHASVSMTDAAGNSASASADQAYSVAPVVPPVTIAIDPIPTVNGAEAASSNPVTITGTVSSSVPVGDTVTLTIDGHIYTGTVQPGGTYSIGVPGNVLAGATFDNVHASVTATDGSGNPVTAGADQPYVVELTAPPIAIGIDPIATINGTEAASSNPVAVTGTVSANVPVGDTVTLTVDGHNYTGTVLAGGTYSIGVPGNVLAGAAVDSVHASVSMTDAAGNMASASADQAYSVVLSGPAITIGIDPIATVNGAEAASANPVAITGSVSANVPVGDTVTLTIDGNQYTGTVQSGGTYSIGVPGNVLAGATSDSVHASVSVTDAGGNVTSASADQVYSVELTAPPISIAIDPIATINGVEAASAAPVTVTGTVSANVPVGDTVTLTVDGHDYTGTVQAGGTYSIGVPGNVLAGAATDSIHASVSTTDAAGNTASASADQAYAVELTGPAISIAIDPIATVNGAEGASSNPIAITGTVSANVPVGDTVTLTVDGHDYTGTVQAGGTYSIGVPGNILAGAATDSIHASVSMTDAAGNTSNAGADQAYAVQLSGAAISIAIDPIATVNGAEAASSNPITITGTVSANVPVGDTVTLTVDGHDYAGTVQAGGTYTIGVPGNILAGAAADNIHASVSTTDGVGNTSTASADQAYTVELSAPPITIAIDPIATVNGAEAASSNPVAITGTVSANVPVGDTVTLTIDGHDYTGTVQPGGTYSIGVPGNILAGATTDNVHASVSMTDAAGNSTSAAADQAYTVELAAPAISISIDPVATINGAEGSSAAPVAITGTVSGNVPVGDTVTLTVDGHDYTGTVQAGGTYSIGVPGNVLAGAATDSIHASVSMTDAAGNSTNASADQIYNVQLSGPVISIAIDPIATVNGAEAASANPVAVTGTVSSNVPVGDTVTLTVDGHNYTGTVQAGGTYSIGVPGNILAGAPVDSVHAGVSTTDAFGNVSNASADQSYVVELTAPAISIAIDPIATVNGAEAASANPVTITGTVSSNVPVGDTVILTVDGHDYTGTVQAGGTYSIGVPGNILAGAAIDSIHASVSMTDAAGNIANAAADQAYAVELTAPAISIAIDPIATVNGAEAASSNPIAITGTVSANVPVGDTVTLTIDGTQYTGTVQAGGTYSIGVPGNVLAGATTDTIHASVSATDAAGNTASANADQSYSVDTVAPGAPVVAITTDANADGFINSSELNGASTVHAAVTLNAAGQTDLANGGTVQLSVTDAGVTQTLNLHMSGGNLVDGSGNTYGYSGGVISLTEAAPGDGKGISVTATETDAAGNVSALSNAAATEQLSAAAISINIDSIAPINAAENASSNPITITGTVSNNVPVGTTVTLTIDGHNYTGTVDAGDTYSINVPGNILGGAVADNVHASVSTTDAVGNVASASADQAYVVDTIAPGAPAVAIATDTNQDGVINSTELNGATTVHSTVILNAAGQTDLANGGTVQITVVDAGVTQSLNLHMSGGILVDGSGSPYSYSGGVITLTEVAPGDGNTITITSIETDVAGNPSASSSAAATEDISAPGAPIVSISTDTNHDGFINTTELGASSTVQATVALNAAGQTDLANGGTVQLTVVDAGVTQTLNLHMSGGNLVDGSGNTYGYSGGVISLTEAAPGDGKGISVTATETDAAGNVSASSNAAATEQLTAAAISIGIDSIAPINAAENASSNPIAITGTVSSNVPVGTTVTLTIDGHNYTGTVGAGDTYSINVPGNVLGGAMADNVHASVSTTDAVGNVASASADQPYSVDTVAPGAPTVAIATDTNADGFINSSELNGATTVHSTVTLNAAGQTDLVNGGTVQITVVDVGVTQNLNLHLSGGNLVDGSGNTYAYSGGVITLTEAAPGDGNTIRVTSTETDAAGNVSASSNATATQDITAPGAPTVAITTDGNHDGVINSTELSGAANVQATVTFNAAGQSDLANGGTVQITVVDAGATQNLTLHMSGGNLVDGSGNTYSYSGGVITLTETAPGDTKSISVTATETDVAGNVSASSNAAATEYVTGPVAPVVTISSDTNHDGVLSGSEVTAEATAGVAVGTVALNAANLSASGSATVTVVDNGVTTTLNVASNGIVTGAANGVSGTYSGGVVTVNFINPGDAHSATITATQTDQYGNTANSNTASVTEHIAAPPAPVVTITSDSNHDGVLNSGEISAEATAGVAVGIVALNAANLSASGSATVTIVDNGVTTTLNVASNGTVTGAANGVSGTYSAGVVTVNFSNPGDTHSATIAATQTDQYGNTANGNTASVTEHIAAPPAPVVTITSDSNDDGVLNSSEVTAEATAGVAIGTVALNAANLSASGSATVTVVDNGVTTTLNIASNGTVTGAANGVSGTYSGGVVTVNFINPGDAHSATITATQTDRYGNTANSNTASVTEHIAAPPAPVVTITSDSNHDGVLNISEVTAETTAGVAVGTVALNAANLGASGSATVTVVDNGVATTLNVASNGAVTGAANGVSGTYSAGVVTVNFTNPGDAHSATITATQTDQYGNTANSNTASVTEHISAPPAPVVTITSDSNHDGVLNSSEVTAEATAGVAVGTVALNAANLIASGSATVTVVDNGVTTTLNVASNGTVTGAANGVSGTYSGGVVTVNFVNPGDAHSASITATQTDQYGNTANGNTASVTEHIAAPPAPVVTITSDSNHDGVLNSSEVTAEATAGVAIGTVALNAVNLSASGSATVTVVDNGVTTTLNVASNGTVTGAANGVSGTYSAGVVTVNFANPGDAHSATITATQTDQYGNTANGNTASVTEHIAAPP
ncbi:MAG TPA: Ig-like domain-containing protein, partial [Burkholderiaceae bacterium]